MRNLIIYIVFLCITSFAVFGSNPAIAYYFTKAVKDIFVEKQFSINGFELTFREIYHINQIWHYIDKVFINGIYWDTDQDNVSTRLPSNVDDAKILLENRLLGVPRLRQLRVKNTSCTIDDAFQNYFTNCFADYSAAFEDKKSFGKGFGSAWTYSEPKKINGSNYRGHLTVYGGGGYYVDLPVAKNDAVNLLKELKLNNWLDRGMRVLFIDFTLYNANTNLFSVVKLIFERSSVGNVITTWSIASENLLKYVDGFDYVIMAFEIIFILFVIIQTFEVFFQLYQLRSTFFKKFWNVFDIMLLVMSYTMIIFNIHLYAYLRENLKTLILKQNDFLDFEELASAALNMNSVTSVFVFFLWMKLFQFLNFNKTMLELLATLSRGAKDICSFAIVFFIVFCAFAQMGTIFLGMKVYNFSTFGRSMLILLRTILGDFNYEEIENADRFLGPLFFMCYIFFVFFVLMNMFLAILTEAYTQIKSMEKETDENNVFRIIARKIRHMRLLKKIFGTVISNNTDISDLTDDIDKESNAYTLFNQMARKETIYETGLSSDGDIDR